VHEKAADELVGGECHHFVAVGTFDPVVLPLEGDAVLAACDQAAIGDGDISMLNRWSNVSMPTVLSQKMLYQNQLRRKFLDYNGEGKL
jgi:hypothetical protein